MNLFPLEISLAIFLVVSCVIQDFLELHLSYRAYDYFSKLIVIVTLLWLSLIVYRWINL